ncbi:uncharacterized protein A4U43_C10F8200 [Asparagus officinalis]|uniref:Lil3 protein n=1 Tax=Asparagus officinalis TaxID=4686 RepID=A0A5P1E4N6_ASPOF|nr:light-harvesting complex-like protein 3 isotype 1, chloroplastic [Asparagus officinalis]ONK56405.1 uncharacterized protein A4U43_C10F8200 [Asparagus officinalis]
MALFSPSPPTTLFTLSSKAHLSTKTQLTLFLRKSQSLVLLRSAGDNGAGSVGSASVVEEKLEKKEEAQKSNLGLKEEEEQGLGANGVSLKGEASSSFKDPRWVKGNWDLKQFEKNGSTDWDAVIDAEARRRKWLQETPEASSNDEPVVFDSSIIPWWAWIKRYHLPEAELLNGRAAMIGFFMAYFVDSLTGVGLVDQMGNFFCKTLLFIAVSGVLLIRKNEDIETLKKLLDETTFYDKQWQATWQEDDSTGAKKNKT